MRIRIGLPALGGVALSGLLFGCAGAQVRPTTPEREVVMMEEMRIVAREGEDGRTLEAYDAADLFGRATDLLNAQRCEEAVALYDKVAAEFPTSRYVSAALYNAGLCLQALGRFDESAAHYQTLRERLPESPDYRDASFQYAEVLVQLERWQEVTGVADELLALADLSVDERLEAMARRGQGLVGEGHVEEAQRNARGALSYFRTRADGDVVDEFYVAASNYVLAETHRIRAQAMEFPPGTEAQRKVLIERAELLLEAQREYFNTMRFTNLDNFHWSSAALYRIGHMYDELWHAVMAAPLPPSLPAEGEKPYRQELAKLIKPLIRHAIRYWEMTLLYFDDKGVRNRWTEQTKKDLARVRALMLDQPAGPGGLPGTQEESGPSDEPPPQEPTTAKPARDSV